VRDTWWQPFGGLELEEHILAVPPPGGRQVGPRQEDVAILLRRRLPQNPLRLFLELISQTDDSS